MKESPCRLRGMGSLAGWLAAAVSLSVEWMGRCYFGNSREELWTHRRWMRDETG